jgi:hypothetical protein
LPVGEFVLFDPNGDRPDEIAAFAARILQAHTGRAG